MLPGGLRGLLGPAVSQRPVQHTEPTPAPPRTPASPSSRSDKPPKGRGAQAPRRKQGIFPQRLRTPPRCGGGTRSSEGALLEPPTVDPKPASSSVSVTPKFDFGVLGVPSWP